MSFRHLKPVSLILFAALIAAGCSKESSTEVPSEPKLSGIVEAPGGTIAFIKPGLWDSLMAAIFGRQATASFGDVTAVAGANVQLIKIDVSGAMQGTALAEATTGSDGSYSLTLPTGFTPSAETVVRATVGTTSLDAFVTRTDEAVDVNPVTQAANDIILTGLAAANKTLANTSVGAVDQLKTAIIQVALTTDFTGSTADISTLKTAVQTAVSNNEEANNLVTNVGQVNGFCGTVKDDSQTPLENILIVARRYSDWIVEGKTRTDAAGAYCVNVPAGDYILGALNMTGVSAGASQWWSSTNTGSTQSKAEKVTAANPATTKDFTLVSGGRIAGGVTALSATGTALPGVTMLVRDWDSNATAFVFETNTLGKYRINLPAGNYKIEAQNRTSATYASETYNSVTDGAITSMDAEKILVSSGSMKTANFDLQPGVTFFAQVQDGSGAAVAGAHVDIRDNFTNGSVIGLRTNKVGKFRIQLYKGLYSIYVRGQKQLIDARTTTPTITAFNVAVASQPVHVTDGSNAVAQAKVFLRNTTGGYIYSESTNSSGDAVLYANAASATNYSISVAIDDGSTQGSVVYNNIKTKLTNASFVSLTNGVANSLIDVVLPIGGGTVSGKVTLSDGVTPIGNAQIAFLDCAGLTSTCDTGTPTANAANIFIYTRSDSDGTYKIMLPAGQTYGAMTRVFGGTAPWSTPAGQVAVTSGASNTFNLQWAQTSIGPQGVYADTSTTGSVILHWKKAPGAASYKVYRSTNINVDPATSASPDVISAVSGVSYTDTAPPSATTYYYIVTSVDSAGAENNTYYANAVSVTTP